MFRPAALVVALATLAVPALSSADVRIGVPQSLLGGRVAPANALPPPSDPAVTRDPDDGEVDLSDPDFWNVVWPSDAFGLTPPDDVEMGCDPAGAATACGVWGTEAAELDPATTDALGDGVPLPATVDVARALRPRIGTWMTGQTPRLSWARRTGATHYNVQVYLGPRRVASVWTSRTAVTLPTRVIDQGRYYMWAVWPAFGPRGNPRYGEPIGRSVFGVVLRPRLVFRAVPGGVRAEVRPRIPGGLLRIAAPSGVRGRVPVRLRIPVTSRFALGIPRAQAERLRVALIEPGARPPKGIRAR